MGRESELVSERAKERGWKGRKLTALLVVAAAFVTAAAPASAAPLGEGPTVEEEKEGVGVSVDLRFMGGGGLRSPATDKFCHAAADGRSEEGGAMADAVSEKEKEGSWKGRRRSVWGGRRTSSERWGNDEDTEREKKKKIRTRGRSCRDQEKA